MDVFEKDGISLQGSVDGNVLIPDSDGYVGKLSSGFVNIDIKIAEGHNVFCVVVDGKKNVNLKHDTACDAEVVEPGRHYRMKIQIKQGLTGIFHTEYPNNNMRLVEIFDDGRVKMWEASLVSQGGDFFLVIQEVYEFRCYDTGGVLCCPYFETEFRSWPQLILVLGRLFHSLGIDLPQWHGELPEADLLFEGLGQVTAGVLWFNVAQGIGAVQTRDGSARVHWSQITRNGSRLAYLVPGETVQFTAMRTRYQTKARKTSFSREVVGVRLI